ncbi:omega-hydroxyceramide transacylase isoform 2-T2 [Polymixia lowei]
MSSKISSYQFQGVPPSISFSGSGFLATYQLGVAQCLLNCAPWILNTAPLVLGASAGSLVAAAVVCEMSLVGMRDQMLSFANRVKAFTLGPLNPSADVFHWLECVLKKQLPNDAHLLANGRLAVAMTRLPDGRNIVMSEFKSKEDVIQALLCSCFVPGYSGILPPTFKGVHYVDGGFSSLQPILSGWSASSQTLTVSPFSGEMDICPRDETSLCNMTLEQSYHSGYKDAFQFLQSSGGATLDLAPYMTMGPLRYYYPTKTSIHLEEIEEEETTALAPFIGNRCMQGESTAEDELTCNLPSTERDFFLDLIQNALLCNLLSYLGMLGFPMTALSYLLLPFTLLLCCISQNMRRLALWSSQAPVWLFWAWRDLIQSDAGHPATAEAERPSGM